MKIVIEIPDHIYEHAKNMSEDSNDEYDAMRAIAKGEKEGSQWIPCSELLPDKHGYYIVQTDGSRGHVIDIAEYGKYGNLVWGWNKTSKIIAWMPLPKPYERGEAE